MLTHDITVLMFDVPRVTVAVTKKSSHHLRRTALEIRVGVHPIKSWICGRNWPKKMRGWR
jgi:hypothetical protein